MTANDPRPAGRLGGTRPIVIVLQTGILVTCVALVVLVSRGGPELPPPPSAVNDPNRIREIIQEGETYDILLKGGFDTRVEDKDWGVPQVINLAFAFEMPLTRTVVHSPRIYHGDELP